MTLKEYWMSEIANTYEFQALAETEQVDIDELEQELQNCLDDQFITTATEYGVARRELMLGIQPFADDTLETRKFKISLEWNNALPYTYKQLDNTLTLAVGEDGFTLDLDPANYTLNITISLGVKRMLDTVKATAATMVPANLIVTVDLQYNRYEDLATFTHAELSAFTHLELREEEL